MPGSFSLQDHLRKNEPDHFRVVLDLRLSRRRCWWRRLRGLALRLLLALLLLLLLLKLLLLFLLRHVMSDDAAGSSTGDAMMAGDVPGDTADDGTLDTALGGCGLRGDEQCNTE